MRINTVATDQTADWFTAMVTILGPLILAWRRPAREYYENKNSNTLKSKNKDTFLFAVKWQNKMFKNI